MELTIILLLFNLFVFSVVLAWIPLLNTLGKLLFSAVAFLLGMLLALYCFEIELVTANPVLTSTLVETINSSFTNTTYTYSLDPTYTTTSLPNTWTLSYLFFGLGAVMFVRMMALPFVMMAEAAQRKREEEEEDLSEI